MTREQKIIALREEQKRTIKYLKEKIERGYHDRLMRRLEQINKELEVLTKSEQQYYSR